VESTQIGASLVVDGVARGITPMPRGLPLSVGDHDVYVGLEGYRVLRERVNVAWQGTTTVKAKLSPGAWEPPPSSVTVTGASSSSSSSCRPGPAGGVDDLQVDGVEPGLGRVIGSLLVAEARKRNMTIVDGEAIRALLANTSAAAAPQTCEADGCFAELADALGVDDVVVGQLTEVQGQTLFGLRRIAQQSQSVVKSSVEKVATDDVDALLPLVGLGVERLFVDVPLRAGERAGVDDRATRLLHPPPLPPVVPLGLLGLSAAAALASTTSFVLVAVGASAHNEGVEAARATGQPLDGRALRSLEDGVDVGVVAGEVALAVALTAGIASAFTALMTNWDDREGSAP
jgi:hypothetical protein